MGTEISSRFKLSPLTLFVLAISLLAVIYAVVVTRLITPSPGAPEPAGIELAPFTSEADFADYLEEGRDLGFGAMGMGRGVDIVENLPVPELRLPLTADGTPTAVPGRVSETYVQVAGIDEPDIVKTNGTELFVSREQYAHILRSLPEREIPTIYPPPQVQQETTIVKAFPLTSLQKVGAVPMNGDLLLAGESLLVFGNNEIRGFDVSFPSKPTEQWQKKFSNTTRVVTSRLLNGMVLVVTQTTIDAHRPCPVPILLDESLSIPCTGIYHPTAPVPIDATFTTLLLNPDTGAVTDTVSFVGSSSASVVYVSEKALYLTYGLPADIPTLMYKFFSQRGSDLVSEEVQNKLANLASYDLSSAAKMTELSVILERYMNSLSGDEQRLFENEIHNRMSDYVKENRRHLEQTAVVKVTTEGLDIAATGTVPGTPLNQFSLDEHDDHLRIAVTLSGGDVMGFGGGESVNDVYVLDSNLRETGSVRDLGISERIYAVRFLGDTGYVVTFRQIDPFYVLDLSNPNSPQRAGELKIPGYSSFLHPLADEVILGVGMDNGKVKVSLFDVANPATPTELSTYILDEYTSDLLQNHRAFLHDEKHGVFFIPGPQGGYIFSYDNNQLQLRRAVGDIAARRALFLDDYLYIVGTDRMVVLDETTWERAGELLF